MNIGINLVFEDAVSGFLMTKILAEFGDKFYVGTSYSEGGFGYIRSNISGFNQAAVVTPFFVLTDLDRYECPQFLREEWLTVPAKPNLIFRVAVREVEAWILADAEGLSEFIGVNKVNFPSNPDVEIDPKVTLINLVKRSRNRRIKDDIVPKNEYAKIGPNYNERLMTFIGEKWDISRAISRSQSLKRAYDCLDRFNYIAP